ncbi:MAG: hypothetical protein WCO97_11995 [bacterium]
MILLVHGRRILMGLGFALFAGCDGGSSGKIVLAPPLSGSERIAFEKALVDQLVEQSSQQAAERQREAEDAKKANGAQEPARPSGAKKPTR